MYIEHYVGHGQVERILIPTWLQRANDCIWRVSWDDLGQMSATGISRYRITNLSIVQHVELLGRIPSCI